MAGLEKPSQPPVDIDDDTSSGESGTESKTSPLSTGVSSPASLKQASMSESGPRIDLDLAEFYSENVAAKIWRVASNLLQEVDKSVFYMNIST